MKDDSESKPSSTLYEENGFNLEDISNYDLPMEITTDVKSNKAQKYDPEKGGLDPIERIPTSK